VAVVADACVGVVYGVGEAFGAADCGVGDFGAVFARAWNYALTSWSVNAVRKINRAVVLIIVTMLGAENLPTRAQAVCGRFLHAMPVKRIIVANRGNSCANPRAICRPATWDQANFLLLAALLKTSAAILCTDAAANWHQRWIRIRFFADANAKRRCGGVCVASARA